MSAPGAETAEPSCMVETHETVEAAETVRPGEAVEAAAATAETGEAVEGIAVAVIRPVIVTRPARGIVAAGRETVITRGNGVTGWASWNRFGRGERRAGQHGRGRQSGAAGRGSPRWFLRGLRVDRDRPGQPPHVFIFGLLPRRARQPGSHEGRRLPPPNGPSRASVLRAC